MFDSEELLQTGHRIAAMDVRDLTDDELLAAAVTAERLDSLVGVTRAHLLAELELRKVALVRHGLHAATWVAREANTSPVATRTHLKIGKALRRYFGEVDAAVIAGEISMEHAKVIVSVSNSRNADGLAEQQGEIIADAKGAVFAEWRDTVRRLALLLDADGAPPTLDDNELRLVEGLDGMGHLAGTLTPDQWLTLKTAVKERADKLFHEFQNMADLTDEVHVPARKTLLALALVELVREGLGIDLATTAAPRTDATVILRPGDADQGEPDVVVDGEGVRLPTSVLPLFLCDAAYTALLVDKMDLPLKLGRSKRFGTAAQRRAAAARDGGCTWPGCDRPVGWAEMHHAEEWDRHHGLTDIENLPLLCRLHHHVVHRPGWAMHATDDGWFFIQSPNGTTFWAQRHFRRRSDPPPPPRSAHVHAT